MIDKFIASRCGWLSSAVSAALSCLIALYGWHLLTYSSTASRFSDRVGMIPFLFNGVLILVVVEMARRTRVKAITAKEEAEAANEQLLLELSKRRQTEQELEESNRKLIAMSSTDGLTGIANRRHFDEALAREYARLARSGAQLSLIMIDVDYFKLFNDNYGHVCGDECLKKIARVIDECTERPADVAARYGGEEFACILPETGLRGALQVAERIRQGIIDMAIPHEWSDVADCVSASLGVVTVQCGSSELVSEIVAHADEFLYKAKSNGRNRVECNEITGQSQVAPNFVEIVWKDSFCSGNRIIDTQHQSLFQISNEFLGAILSNRPYGETSAIIFRLTCELRQHCQDEEAILEETDFPGLEQLVEEHALLLAKVTELSHEYEASRPSVSELFHFLVNEFVLQHMLGADREFFPFIAADVSPESSEQAYSVE